MTDDLDDGDDRWSNPEVVRAVKRLIRSLDNFETETRNSLAAQAAELAEKYVTKELLNARMAPVTEARSAAASWVQALVAPLVVGVIVSGFVYLLHGH